MTLPIRPDEMPSVLTVYRPSTTTDEVGGSAVTLTRQPGTIRGKVNQPTAAEQVLAMQAGVNLTITVHLAPDADVHRGDELHGGPDDVLRVESTIHPSQAGNYLRANCERIQSEGR